MCVCVCVAFRRACNAAVTEPHEPEPPEAKMPYPNASKKTNAPRAMSLNSVLALALVACASTHMRRSVTPGATAAAAERLHAHLLQQPLVDLALGCSLVDLAPELFPLRLDVLPGDTGAQEAAPARAGSRLERAPSAPCLLGLLYSRLSRSAPAFPCPSACAPTRSGWPWPLASRG